MSVIIFRVIFVWLAASGNYALPSDEFRVSAFLTEKADLPPWLEFLELSDSLIFYGTPHLGDRSSDITVRFCFRFSFSIIVFFTLHRIYRVIMFFRTTFVKNQNIARMTYTLFFITTYFQDSVKMAQNMFFVFSA